MTVSFLLVSDLPAQGGQKVQPCTAGTRWLMAKTTIHFEQDLTATLQGYLSDAFQRHLIHFTNNWQNQVPIPQQ